MRVGAGGATLIVRPDQWAALGSHIAPHVHTSRGTAPPFNLRPPTPHPALQVVSPHRRINAHVDARFALASPGRYVNDHFDASRLNARLDKDKGRKRARVVALRRIEAGEEVYASYGETYWRARGIDPATGGVLDGYVAPRVERALGVVRAGLSQ